MMTDDKSLTNMLNRFWQPPAPADDAMARLMARVAVTPQQSIVPASRSRQMIWIAAAASFAGIMLWNGLSHLNSPAPVQIDFAQTDMLDEPALSYVFSNTDEEEYL
jgi:hypothetical protein